MMHNIIETNRLLKFTRDNKDVALRYTKICFADKLKTVGIFDFSFSIRRNESSQGYFFDAGARFNFEGVESEYRLMDWRNFKLRKIIRNSLMAETKAVG